MQNWFAMRGVGLLLAAALGLWVPHTQARTSACRESLQSSAPIKVVVDFQQQIQPILSARCQPCHFPGGSMHGTLPFDQPATIHKLGTRLFTRIRDQKEQSLIRQFLSQK